MVEDEGGEELVQVPLMKHLKRVDLLLRNLLDPLPSSFEFASFSLE